MGRIGATEILLILLVLILLFGAKKIPDLLKGIAQGLKEFKNKDKKDDQEK
jgi:sec-independent protein translocase protein TatA